ncbi:MAG: DNA polymerase III subunit delta' [Caldimonas sp.]
MVGSDGALPLPWLAEPLQRGLQRSAHALLVHGPEGVGQFELALTLAQAWLCEAPAAASDRRKPCGACGSCRLVQAHSHPDLLVLLPDALREALGWFAAGDDEAGAPEKVGKAKPSKEIKVEAVRIAVAFAQTTSARGRGKVVVLHPAERMNAIAANTLLKTLEEPPGQARFLLSCSMPDALLPTIRSRCQALPLGLPPRAIAIDWLATRGVADAAVLLAACGGRPLQALQWSEEGIGAGVWMQMPALLARGEATPFMTWPLPRLVEALQKVCHDALCVASGSGPRYFPPGSIPGGSAVATLSQWGRELSRIADHAEHPWSAGLMVESLIESARAALTPAARGGRRGGSNSLHLRP